MSILRGDELRRRAVLGREATHTAFCSRVLEQLEKRFSLSQMVRYVVALEKKKHPSKVIIKKATAAYTACVLSRA